VIDLIFLKIFDVADEILNSFHNFGNADTCIQGTREACRTGSVNNSPYWNLQSSRRLALWRAL